MSTYRKTNYGCACAFVLRMHHIHHIQYVHIFYCFVTNMHTHTHLSQPMELYTDFILILSFFSFLFILVNFFFFLRFRWFRFVIYFCCCWRSYSGYDNEEEEKKIGAVSTQSLHNNQQTVWAMDEPELGFGFGLENFFIFIFTFVFDWEWSVGEHMCARSNVCRFT